MTDINHRRKNKPQVDRRYNRSAYSSGFARDKDQDRAIRVGKTGYLDKSMHGSARKSILADKTVSARIGNDFCNGHRGMAKAIRGAKKSVRSRIRFNENRAVRKLVDQAQD